MPRITLELLRRRAEHNEGCLSDLKEVALHQQDIEKIELIGDCCRQLEIIYLCNNYIPKIEGLRHLKWLKYLNLAVNNITVIEGLEGCESLERLDLTLNFIADHTTAQRLLANPALAILHLTGNPCAKTPGYRAYMVHTLPQLKELDGEEIIRSERIVARQEEEDIIEVTEEAAMRTREAERIKTEMIAKGIDPFPAKYNESGERVYGHTPEERLQMLREQQEQEERKKKEAAEPVPGSISALHKELNKKTERLTPEEEMQKYGRLLMRNEAKVPFTIDEDGTESLVVTVNPGKFLSTTLLNVQVEVNCVRVYIKDKLLQLPVEYELSADAAQVQRAATTGQLKITVPYAPHERQRHIGIRGRLASLQVDEEKQLRLTSAMVPSEAENEKKKQQEATKAEELRKALLFPEADAARQSSAAHEGGSVNAAAAVEERQGRLVVELASHPIAIPSIYNECNSLNDID